MIVVVLAGLLAVQQVLMYLQGKVAADERRRFLAAVMSKDPGEYVAVERATAPRRQKKRPKRSENVPSNPIGL